MLRKFNLLLLITILTIVITTNCSKKDELNPVTPTVAGVSSNGSLGFHLSTASDEIVSGTVTITKGTMVLKKSITITDRQGTVTFTDIQVGEWSILVQLYDADGYEIYTGTGNAVVNKDDTTVVNITVDQNTGNLQINVNVPGLVLWNKLGSDTEVQNSEVGVDGVIVGSLIYEPVKYNNGVYANNTVNNYPDFNGLGINGEHFTIEFWIKPKQDIITGVTSGIYQFFTGFDSGNNYQYAFYYNGSDGYKTFVTELSPNRLTLYWPNVNFTNNILYHVAYVVDRNLSGKERCKLFINGVEQSSVVHVDNGNAPADFDEIWLLEQLTHAYNSVIAIDNIKIWDYAKTSFDDRFTE